MKRLLVAIVLLFTGFSSIAYESPPELRFVALDIYLQSDEPIAAWQFDLADRQGMFRIVGIENGDSAAYQRAPYYDREAVNLGQSDRIVVANYSLEEPGDLPSGRFRLATVHLVQQGMNDLDINLELVNATNYDGVTAKASISWAKNTGSKK